MKWENCKPYKWYRPTNLGNHYSIYWFEKSGYITCIYNTYNVVTGSFLERAAARIEDLEKNDWENVTDLTSFEFLKDMLDFVKI